jgi:hypothetical protein
MLVSKASSGTSKFRSNASITRPGKDRHLRDPEELLLATGQAQRPPSVFSYRTSLHDPPLLNQHIVN